MTKHDPKSALPDYDDPPLYTPTTSKLLPHRSPTEEAIYLNSLQAWATEKDTMKPGDGTFYSQPNGGAGPSEGTAITLHYPGQEARDARRVEIMKMPRETEEEERLYEENLGEWVREDDKAKKGSYTTTGRGFPAASWTFAPEAEGEGEGEKDGEEKGKGRRRSLFERVVHPHGGHHKGEEK